jgi:hypothetical protein
VYSCCAAWHCLAITAQLFVAMQLFTVASALYLLLSPVLGE